MQYGRQRQLVLLTLLYLQLSLQFMYILCLKNKLERDRKYKRSHQARLAKLRRRIFEGNHSRLQTIPRESSGTMADPLGLLRKYNVNKKEIVEHDGNIVFDEISWSKTVKTNYLTFSSSKGTDKCKEYYTLECLLFLLNNVELAHPAYVRKASSEGVPYIQRPDRKHLLAFLNGEKESSPNIDASVTPEPPIRETPKRTLEDDEDDDDHQESSEAKKAHLEDENDSSKPHRNGSKIKGSPS